MSRFLVIVFFLYLWGCSSSSNPTFPKVSSKENLPAFLASRKSFFEGLGLLQTTKVEKVYQGSGYKGFALSTAIENGSRINGRLSHQDIQWEDSSLYLIPIFQEDGKYLLSVLTSFGLEADGAFQVLLIQGSNIEHTGILTVEDGGLKSLIKGDKLIDMSMTACLRAKFEDNWGSNRTEESISCFANFGTCFWARVADCVLQSGEARDLLTVEARNKTD